MSHNVHPVVVDCTNPTAPTQFWPAGLEISAIRVEVLPAGVELSVILGGGQAIPVLNQGVTITLAEPESDAISVAVVTAGTGSARLVAVPAAGKLDIAGGVPSALGQVTDPASLAGNGSVIGILKQNRIYLAAIAAALAGTIAVSLTVLPALSTGQNHVGRVTVDSLFPNAYANAPAKNMTFANVSLGDTTSKQPSGVTTGLFVACGGTSSVVTTAVTAFQSITACTPTAGRTYFLESVVIQGRFTTPSATATFLGTVFICGDNAASTCSTTFISVDISNATTSSQDVVVITLPEPIALANTGSTQSIDCRVTPAVVTSITWRCNLIGWNR